jgi:hypothetical protein
MPRPSFAGVLPIFGAAAARHGLDDLGLFPGTGILDKTPDVDDAIVTGVGVFLIFGGWVRGCARLSGVHSVFSVSVGRSRGVREHSPGSMISG